MLVPKYSVKQKQYQNQVTLVNKNVRPNQTKKVSPKLIRKQNINNAYNNENYYYYSNNNSQESRQNFTYKKPDVGITRESRTRKTPNLNIIRSSRMSKNLSFDHVIVTDKYNNRLILPVAKF